MELVENFKVVLEFQTVVDSESGEVTTKCIKKSIDKLVNAVEPKRKKSKKEESTIPELTLEDNKYCLNQAAIELLGVSPDDRLDIMYQKQGNSMIPVIGTSEAFGSGNGNRLTKSHTVAYRGARNEELAKYGKIFKIVPRTTEEGLFNLVGDIAPKEEIEDENVTIDDLDISDLVDNSVEVDSSIFKL